MSVDKPESGDSRRDEVIAGEYVLGVLSADDRRKVEARMVLDRSFAAIVNRWQDNLFTLEDEYTPVTPSARLLGSVERRLFSEPMVERRGVKTGVWNSLPFWRSLTLATGVAAAALFAVVFDTGTPAPPGAALVADMAGQQGAGIDLLAHYDQTSGVLKVTPVATTVPEARSLELWLIEDSGTARSLGILPKTGDASLIVPQQLRGLISTGKSFAVSVEPFGGSPTGSATGPVIALGKTRQP